MLIEKFKNKNSYFEGLLFLYIIIQPILELSFFWETTYISVFGMSLAFLFRYLLLQILFIYYLMRGPKKHRYYLFVFSIVLVVYIILHHMNVVYFPIQSNIEYNYSFFDELKNILKMLMPLQMIYCVFRSEVKISKVVDYMAYAGLGFIYLLILFNIFKLGYGSYIDMPILANIFEWQSGQYLYYELASRGFYLFVNPLSLVISIFTGFIIISPTLKFKLFHLLSAIIAGLMIGTKVASYGPIIMIIVYGFITLYTSVRDKKYKPLVKQSLTFITCLLIFLTLFPISPAKNRSLERNNTVNEAIDADSGQQGSNDIISNDSSTNSSNSNGDNSIDKPTVETDIEKFYSKIDEMPYNDALNYLENLNSSNRVLGLLHLKEKAGIAPWFVEDRYPIEHDFDFWLEIYRAEPEDRTSFRFLQVEIANRVSNLRKGNFDFLLGQSQSLNNSIMFVERDYFSQFYNFGVIGLLLFIFPYIFVLFYKFKISRIFRFKTEEYFVLAMYCFSLLVAFYSGNIFEFQLSNTIVSIVAGIIMKERIYYEN